jgi:hypothetical protein
MTICQNSTIETPLPQWSQNFRCVDPLDPNFRTSSPICSRLRRFRRGLISMLSFSCILHPRFIANPGHADYGAGCGRDPFGGLWRVAIMSGNSSPCKPRRTPTWHALQQQAAASSSKRSATRPKPRKSRRPRRNLVSIYGDLVPTDNPIICKIRGVEFVFIID